MGCNTSQEKSQCPVDEEIKEDGVIETHTSNHVTNGSKGDDGQDKKRDEQHDNISNNLKDSSQPKQITKITAESLENGNGSDNARTDEEDAATKIQAVFRGHKVRTTMKQGDNPASNSESVSKSVLSNNADDPTKEELEAEFSADDKELCSAATRIQATFRGHMQRKLANNELKDDADIEEITKKVAEELDIDLTDPELNKAATKIQASFRGHKTRKEVVPETENKS